MDVFTDKRRTQRQALWKIQGKFCSISLEQFLSRSLNCDETPPYAYMSMISRLVKSLLQKRTLQSHKISNSIPKKEPSNAQCSTTRWVFIEFNDDLIAYIYGLIFSCMYIYVAGCYQVVYHRAAEKTSRKIAEGNKLTISNTLITNMLCESSLIYSGCWLWSRW